MATQVESLNAGLTRTQVALLLGVSDREVAKMDGRQLHPSRAANRAWLYEPAEVRALLVNAATVQPPDLDGELTAGAFALFEARKSLAKAVIALKAPANVVIRLRSQYDEMRGALTLLNGGLLAVKRLLGDDAIRNGGDLLGAIQRALEAKVEEGRLEAHEFGVLLNNETGKMEPVMPTTSTISTDVRPAPTVVPPATSFTEVPPASASEIAPPLTPT